MLYFEVPAEIRFFCNETECMNALQEHGIISDNCVWWLDIGNTEEAILWLTQNGKKE